MIRLILGRLALLIGISIISFWVIHLAPGDPTSMMIDPRISALDRAALQESLGLNHSLPSQYMHWLGQIVQGNFGFSYVSGQPVLGLILGRLWPTLILSVSTLLLCLVLAVPLGLVAAYWKNRLPDRLISWFSLLGLAIPSFWLGLLLVLGFSLKWSIFPTSGWLSPELIDASWGTKLLDISHHLVLPLVTLVIGSLAGLIRYSRFQAIAELMKGYVTAGRARGFSHFRILIFHVLKNTLLPLITLLGLELPGLVSGAFVVEYIFAWPGMGQLGVNAIFARDYPVIMGILLMSSVLMLLGTILADIGYTKADPRIRLR